MTPNHPLVTHVLYSGLGGHGAVLLALLSGGFMREAQHRVVFLGTEQPLDEYVRACDARGIAWQYQPKMPGSEHFKFTLGLRRLLMERNPDVLFLHGLAALPSVALVRVAPGHKQPFVIVRETQANHLKTRRDWTSLALAHAFADRIVHLTKDAGIGAGARLGRFVKPGKVTVIPNGLDTSFFSPATEHRAADRVIRIGMQSRLQPNKDHATLVAAFAALCSRNPALKCELHIAGEGSTFLDIERVAEELGVREKTKMRGMLGGTALRDFLRQLDIYAHCTHGETMSTAIMQALACGLPVIASDVAGVRNMVGPRSGMLYEAGSVEDLASKMQYLIDSPEESAAWRMRARDFAVMHFSTDSMVTAYESILPARLRTHAPDTVAMQAARTP